MKKTVLKIVAVLVLGLSFASCTKKSTTPTTPASTTPSYSATIGGTATTFTGSASLGANYLTVSGTSSTYTIAVYIPTPVSTGTQAIGTVSGSTAYVVVQTSAGQYWSSTSGSLTISTYNSSTKIVSGTFNCSLSGSSNISLTNGSFANISF